MSLKHISQYQLQAASSLFADNIFDIFDYREVKCVSIGTAQKELALYNTSAKIIATYPQESHPPHVLQLENLPNSIDDGTYIVFSINRSGDLIKDLKLHGSIKNVNSVFVTTSNTIIYSTNNVSDVFFTNWFPHFLMPYNNLDVFVKVKSPDVAGGINLSYTGGLIPIEIKSIFTRLCTRLLISPYSCILSGGVNIAGNALTRDGFELSSHYTDKMHPAGTFSVKNFRTELSKFGNAHRNIRVITNTQCQVNLLLNDQVYYSKSIESGVNILHDVPIIHSPFTVCSIDIVVSNLGGDKPTIKWDVLEFYNQGYDISKNVIVTPEFGLISSEGLLSKKTLGKLFSQ